MENAAKALTIAGGVLIAVMLAVLVYYVFTHWGESQKMDQEEIEVQKVNDFNKSYLSYEKTLYGSELLGLVNKMNDYNESKDITYLGYGKMSIKVSITDSTEGNLFNKGTYGLTQINNTVQDVMKKTTESSKYKGKISDANWEHLAKASSNSAEEFNKLCDNLNIDPSIDRTDLQSASVEYYKYIQFKRKKFKHTGTTFFDTGRVNTMSFEEGK